MWSTLTHACPEGGGRPPRGGPPRRRADKTAKREHGKHQERWGAQHSEGRVEETPQKYHRTGFSATEGGGAPSTKEGAELKDFTPMRVHL